MESWTAAHLPLGSTGCLPAATMPLTLSVQQQYRLPPDSHPAAAAPLSLSMQQQYRLPPVSHPAAAAPLTLSVCAKVVPVTSQQLSSSGRASLCLCRSSTGYLPTVIQQWPRLYLSLSVQNQYRLPPGSHPAAQRQYRGRERGAAAAGRLP